MLLDGIRESDGRRRCIQLYYAGEISALGECLAAKRLPARMIPITPYGARFFKNARACPRPANPHIQGPLQILQRSPPLSADSFL
jgi:hypothetical protein